MADLTRGDAILFLFEQLRETDQMHQEKSHFRRGFQNLVSEKASNNRCPLFALTRSI